MAQPATVSLRAGRSFKRPARRQREHLRGVTAAEGSGRGQRKGANRVLEEQPDAEVSVAPREGSDRAIRVEVEEPGVELLAGCDEAAAGLAGGAKLRMDGGGCGSCDGGGGCGGSCCGCGAGGGSGC